MSKNDQAHRVPLRGWVGERNVLINLIVLTIGALLQTNLLAAGLLLQEVRPVSPEAQEHIAALRRRADSGDVKAQVDLGVAYASGDGVPADEVEAVRWFRKAAEKGNADGEYSLGEMYLSGRGVSVDLTVAAKWISMAAEGGDARAQFNLAAMYANGTGVEKSATRAAQWMRKAADQRFPAGQFGMGMMYAHGTGVPRSERHASEWYRKAADQGDPVAMNNLALLLATSSDPRVRNAKEAVPIAQWAIEMDGNNPMYIDTLALAYFKAGQPDLAAETERRALTLKPEDAFYKKALQKYEAATRKSMK